jgi:hypothetical protein
MNNKPRVVQPSMTRRIPTNVNAGLAREVKYVYEEEAVRHTTHGGARVR